MKKKKLVCAVGGLVLSSSVFAADNIRLEEVVVTAQKQSQTVQDVPITVNVVGGDNFRGTVGLGLEDLGRMTAGLGLQSTGNTQNITMRGIGTDLQGASQARVTTYLDGSYIGSQQLMFTTQFDIQRYEILRGPQGTLYGKASPTGAIIVHTQNPNLSEVEGSVAVTAGEYGLFNTELGLSLPLIEGELGVRIAGIYNEDGSDDVSNIFYGRSESRTRGGRMTALWEPGSEFMLRLSHSYVENTPAGLSQIEGNGIKASDRRSVNDVKRKANARINTSILSMEWDIDWATLVSQSLYASTTNNSLEDTDLTSEPKLSEDVRIHISPIFNQELRLESLGNEHWDWMLGGYYQKTEASIDVVSRDDSALSDIFGQSPVWMPASESTHLTLNSATEDFGLYSHNTFFLDDNWTATLGARWTKERRYDSTAAVFNFDAPMADLSFSQPLPDFITSNTFYDWSGTAKLQYDFSVDQMAYFTLDSGGKSGGQSLDLSGNIPADRKTYDDESSTSFELGYKSSFVEGRMNVNAAIYHTAYKNFQLNATDIEILNGGDIEQVTFIDNADKVVAKGVEVELQYQISANWYAGTSVAYNDTRFKEYSDAPCNAGAPSAVASTCDRSDERLGGDSSQWSMVAQSEYTQALNWQGVEWYISGLYNFNSSRLSAGGEQKMGGFGTIDAFTGIRSQNGDWDVKLWVKNLADKEAVTSRGEAINLTDMSLAFSPVALTPVTSYDSGYRSLSYTKPRQLGVSLNYNF